MRNSYNILVAKSEVKRGAVSDIGVDYVIVSKRILYLNKECEYGLDSPVSG
jgi:hypothetical protein